MIPRTSSLSRVTRPPTALIGVVSTVLALLPATRSAAASPAGGRRAAAAFASQPPFGTRGKDLPSPRRTTRLASSLGFASPSREDEGGGGDDSVDKWESLYQEGGRTREEAVKKAMFGESLDVDPASASRSELRVVTFDLDNTLWKTGAVISAANNALSSFLEERGVATPVRTEVVMGDLFKKDKARYCPLMEEKEEIVGANVDDDGVDNVGKSNVYIQSGAHKPVLLTQLRKDAVAEILVRHNNYNRSDAADFAEEAFDVWTTARHDAIPHHLAPSGVLDVFKRIRSLRTSTGEPPVVGAITDGNSDPRTVPDLGEYFDFVVNSEGVGVAKPDRRVYYAAVKEAASNPSVADLFASVLDAEGNVNEDAVEDALGPWWCHVGDDFIKDCVAAKELKMRSVWCRELVLPSKEEAAEKGKSSKAKRDVADLVKELAEMKVIEMSIGAEDFVADSIHREFSDAILDRFDDLGDTLSKWHEEGLRGAAAASNEGLDVVSKEVSAKEVEAAIADVLEVIMPDGLHDTSAVTNAAVGAAQPPAQDEPKEQKRDTKFCMNCGAKLPVEAKFCSACGEKQPAFNQ